MERPTIKITDKDVNDKLKDYVHKLWEYCDHVENRVKSLEDSVNNPQFGDFDRALPLESAHHLERWGNESHREPQHFQMVISYITGKLIDAIWSKDSKKFEHHLITISAVCRTAHKYFKTKGSHVSEWFN